MWRYCWRYCSHGRSLMQFVQGGRGLHAQGRQTPVWTRPWRPYRLTINALQDDHISLETNPSPFSHPYLFLGADAPCPAQHISGWGWVQGPGLEPLTERLFVGLVLLVALPSYLMMRQFNLVLNFSDNNYRSLIYSIRYARLSGIYGQLSTSTIVIM